MASIRAMAAGIALAAIASAAAAGPWDPAGPTQSPPNAQTGVRQEAPGWGAASPASPAGALPTLPCIIVQVVNGGGLAPTTVSTLDAAVYSNLTYTLPQGSSVQVQFPGGHPITFKLASALPPLPQNQALPQGGPWPTLGPQPHPYLALQVIGGNTGPPSEPVSNGCTAQIVAMGGSGVITH